MGDQSYLDKKCFIDTHTYNCPFCNRRHVTYTIKDWKTFDWSCHKKCFVYFVKCNSCENTSMHLSFNLILEEGFLSEIMEVFKNIDIDSAIFYSVPTSFFVLDNRIPNIIRELISEAEGCLKMNYLTGASACMRKAIYEMLTIEEVEGKDYQTRIKSLKKKYPDVNEEYFNILAHIQDMTSDKIHEQSWDKWDSSMLHLIIETLKSVLYDIYVLPKEKEQRSTDIKKLREQVASVKPKTKQHNDEND